MICRQPFVVLPWFTGTSLVVLDPTLLAPTDATRPAAGDAPAGPAPSRLREEGPDDRNRH